ncbi:YslB family protein [Lapidilactobacillus mulanensis]|uniref:YslB family protein n=1 Tax=Lapidilactobacillus mulanensis TaxID=2485999 RepID=A0ABW4DKC0_9LACO|nr:YslB family protein [Lapidilactobacillus mulanensis]
MNLTQLQHDLTESPETFHALFSREILLPELLGDDTEDLTYWLGKRIARQFPLATFADTTQFFQTVRWGDLTIGEHKKGTTTLFLDGKIVSARLALVDHGGFNLETGFLAETFQQQNGYLTEATYTVDQKQNQVVITLQSDLKDPLTNQAPQFIQFTAPVKDLPKE